MLGAIPLVIHDENFENVKTLMRQKEDKEQKIKKELHSASTQ